MTARQMRRGRDTATLSVRLVGVLVSALARLRDPVCGTPSAGPEDHPFAGCAASWRPAGCSLEPEIKREIGGGADTAGNVLAADAAWTFTTQAQVEDLGGAEHDRPHYTRRSRSA